MWNESLTGNASAAGQEGNEILERVIIGLEKTQPSACVLLDSLKVW